MAALSLLALVDQFAGDEAAIGEMYRIEGGNDLLATRVASRLGDRVHGGVEVLGFGLELTRTAQVQSKYAQEPVGR